MAAHHLKATSPLTYNIVGHLKTVSILTMGVIVFGDSINWQKFLGICMALCGVIWYSLQKLAAGEAAKKAAALAEAQKTGNDTTEK